MIGGRSLAEGQGRQQAQHNDELAEPFSRIFVDRPEADWAFDLLRESVRRLGLSTPYDPRFALTLPQRSGRLALHLNFGPWLVLGFRGQGLTSHRVDLALLAGQVEWDERLTGFTFERKEGEPEVRTYHLPLETVRPLTSDLRAAYQATLDLIAAKFHTWTRSTHWQQHNPEIIEALFDPEKRAQLFSGALAETEFRYERHFTAFSHELAEAAADYEIEEIPDEMEAMFDSLSPTYHADPSMKTIVVERLDGIRPDFQPDLFQAMKNCNNRERMLICLYFMSDLPNENHQFDDIEQNLRQIFPPSIREGKSPTDYNDFQASMVRGTFTDENRKVNQGKLLPQDRLWETPDRGYWRNTPLGNRRALDILGREGLAIKVIPATKPDEAIENGLDMEEALQPQFTRNLYYPLPQLAEDTGFAEVELARWVRAIERKKQAILYGPPGTGKTYLAEKLAEHLIGGHDGFRELVQFHPAYAYEDFIQGIRPQSEGDHLSYPLAPGRLLEFCRRAQARQGCCVLIIDEINRANLARVFGELMYLLEYRDRAIPLAQGGSLRLPSNIRLIGTMNTADRSIALVDHALRRRFAFIALSPNYDALRRYHERRQTGFPVAGLINLLQRLNTAIHDQHYAVGITFFLHQDLKDQLEDIWRMEVEPYLEEYFFDQPDQVDEFRWAKIAPQVLP